MLKDEYPTYIPPPVEAKPKKPFVLPTASPDCRRVFRYLPAVPLYFGLSFFCRTADISKCLFQYDHLLSWPDRFPLPGVFPKRNTHKAFRSVDVLWTSGFFSSLFQMSARHPATVVLCFPLLPQLPVQCGHGRFPAYNTHRSLQCRLPETPTLPPQGW